ncbi:hypothetical protein K458DRAFT_306664 [Lentithecium fluviatile CBS 122367]|uniref:DUF676 domain-containing protein n=1 Tax=Lentithecium fluviatile CBS 122367 TaxID=1168545 RepID=A0A6G1IWE0_9PLEO|nr:hypothetical protein K458DRAFT_306664 [Lentithecium fluviatile CBS 122367]
MHRPLGGALDELYPSFPNILALTLHGFLILLQTVFLVSLPALVLVPVWSAALYMTAVLGVNWAVCRVLNGKETVVQSSVELGREGEGHESEEWIYLNGVSIGHHWLHSNANRLAFTFRRPVTAVHNRTWGIIFDLLQCIIERNFCYATSDIRRSYAVVKKALLHTEKNKVVLILHSQGGIEGGLILDWLLSELPFDTLHKLEIYTFGSASNHFNNPLRDSTKTATTGVTRNPNAVRHIEHYAAAGEFVARWGVLTFARMENRYMGRVFIRPGTGHLLNQHYLNCIFPLGPDQHVAENSPFMNMEAVFTSDGEQEGTRKGYWETLRNGGERTNGAVVEDRRDGVERVGSWGVQTPVVPSKEKEGKPKVKDFSRLWRYRNGRSPKD